MRSKDLDRYKKLLMDKKEKLTRQVSAMNKEGMDLPQKDAVGELSGYDNHPADTGSETFERSKDYFLRDTIQSNVADINEAIEHLAEGNYGVCVVCGTDIPQERLEAVPSATMCRNCKEMSEMYRG